MKYTTNYTIAALFLLITASSAAQEIGLQLYSLRNQFKDDVETTLKQISDWGITYLEGGETYGMELEEFQKLLDKYGLKVVGIGASYEELQTNPEAVAEKAKSYGASYIMCPWIPHKGNVFTINNAREAVALFNEVGEFFSSRGLTFTYHAHGYEFRPYAEGTLFDFMAKNAEHFKFEMDVYWVTHGGEDALELLERYPDKFALMHLKDMKKGTRGNYTGLADVETNVVLGTGSIDMAAIVEKSRELGIEYLFLEDESSRVLSQIPRSLAYLERL